MSVVFMNSVYDWKFKLKPRNNIAGHLQNRIIPCPRGFTLGGSRYVEHIQGKIKMRSFKRFTLAAC